MCNVCQLYTYKAFQNLGYLINTVLFAITRSFKTQVNTHTLSVASIICIYFICIIGLVTLYSHLLGDWFQELPQISKSTDAQVLYIKWHSICIAPTYTHPPVYLKSPLGYL